MHACSSEAVRFTQYLSYCAGMLSGYLLAEYCPDAHACDASTGEELGELGRCDGRSMWGIITALTLTSPLLILCLQVRLLMVACTVQVSPLH